MKLKSLFNRNKINHTQGEVKSSTPTISSIWDYFHNSGQYYASMSLAYNLYETTSPLSDAIDTIVLPAKAIELNAYDKEDNKIPNHPVMSLINTPNREQGWREFFAECCINKLVSNNMYIIAVGNPKHAPLELYPVKSSVISVSGWDDSNRPVYELATGCKMSVFNGTYKWDNNAKAFLNGNLKELIHLKGYARNNSQGYIGMPFMNSVMKEIEQANGSAVHNLSLLNNGVTLSGIFRLATNDAKALEQFRKDVTEHFTGSAKAGKFIAAHADNIDFKPINATNKDMQIVELKKDAEDAIYKKYNIPSPLYTSSAQTYSNYSTAKISLYDDAVLPLVDDILGKLNVMLLRRQALQEGQKISYSQNDIPALQERTATRVKELGSVGVLSDNEIRSELGYEGYAGGDSIYKPVGVVPVNEDGTVEPRQESLGQEEGGIIEDEEKAFTQAVKNLGYSEQEAKELWQKA